MPDLAAAYADTRESMMKIAGELTHDELATRVPACPDWTVHDLISHVTSLASSIAGGEVPPDLNPVASLSDPEMAKRRDAFVDAALAARRGKPIRVVLDEWRAAAPMLESMIRGERPWPHGAPPLAEWVVTTDVAVHHHDLRGAVGRAGERDSLATGLSLRSYVETMKFRAQMQGLAAFKIVAGTRDWTIGSGEPVATVSADPFELARAASGRRSPDQIRAYDWTGDPEPFIPLFYPYGPRESSLVE
jgi:uncharacterized protein (TIGR03083 family)